MFGGLVNESLKEKWFSMFGGIVNESLKEKWFSMFGGLVNKSKLGRTLFEGI